MNEKWDSESLRWIHDLRKKSYQKTKGKALKDLPVGPSKAAKALAKKLGLQRVALRTESIPAAKSKTHSK
jgi:hypothetical protein